MKVFLKKLHHDAKVPTYATDGSGCFDLYSISEGCLYPHSSTVLNTGLAFQIPKDHVMLLFSRSGQGFHYDVRLGNCVGVIDEDYTGEVKIKLHADSNHQIYSFKKGDRVAQGLIIKREKVSFTWTDTLHTTERGDGGFGSTN